MTTRDKTRRKKPDDSKALRNASMRAMAAEGMKTTEIADHFGVARQTVSKILNSEETKKVIKEAESRVTGMIGKSLDVVELALDDAIAGKLESMGNGLKASLSDLKSSGNIKEKIELTHAFPKPTIIEKRDGTQVVMGVEEEEETK
jgi:predicted transcriptional regulator